VWICTSILLLRVIGCIISLTMMGANTGWLHCAKCASLKPHPLKVFPLWLLMKDSRPHLIHGPFGPYVYTQAQNDSLLVQLKLVQYLEIRGVYWSI